MDTISLNNILPNVFSNMPELRSEVWCKDISFIKGKTYLVEAYSGAGKSSLCHYIIGYRQDYTGNLLFDNRNSKTLDKETWKKIRRENISHLFQELRLFPELTAWENIVLKNNLTHYLSEEQIKEYLEFLGLTDKTHSLCAKLSYGQQQRVAAIRALAQPFDFMFIDEPISHLDEDNAQNMGKLFSEECRKRGASLVVTSIGKHFDLAYDYKFML